MQSQILDMAITPVDKLNAVFFFYKCRSVAVSAAVFRVFGKDAAEVPLIATHHKSRGKVKYSYVYVII